MQSSIESLKESSAITCPLVKVGEQERRVHLSQPLSPLIAFSRQSPSPSIDSDRNLIKEAFYKRAKLCIGSRPIAARMRGNALIEVTSWNYEIEVSQKPMNFVICPRKVEFFRESSSQLPTFHRKSVSLETSTEIDESLLEQTLVKMPELYALANGFTNKLFQNQIDKIVPVLSSSVRILEKKSSDGICAIPQGTRSHLVLKTMLKQEPSDSSVSHLPKQVSRREESPS